MTTYDLIDRYMFDYISTSHLNLKNCDCCSMVEEMNNIRSLYNSGSPIKDVIEKCVCNRHGHQYCIPGKAVSDAVNELLKGYNPNPMTNTPFINNNKFIYQFNDFEELYDFVRYVIGGINNIGPLTVYDTARRIGHLLENPIYPKMYVYLAAGAQEAAKKLLGYKTKFREPIDAFKPFFGTLQSIFIEDILCIFKGCFSGATNGVVNPSGIASPSCVFSTSKIVNSI